MRIAYTLLPGDQWYSKVPIVIIAVLWSTVTRYFDLFIYLLTYLLTYLLRLSLLETNFSKKYIAGT